LEENDELVKISLDLKINSELISEILSFGEHVKVIGPEELRTKIRQTAKNILKSLE
jgi:predicted DNA-binding transcriptional regulator YafY